MKLLIALMTFLLGSATASSLIDTAKATKCLPAGYLCGGKDGDCCPGLACFHVRLLPPELVEQLIIGGVLINVLVRHQISNTAYCAVGNCSSPGESCKERDCCGGLLCLVSPLLPP